MTNNFQEMFKTMMQEMMAQMMAQTMQEMMAEMMPSVASAEAEKPKKAEKIGMAEWMAMAEKPSSPKNNNIEAVDFEPVNSTTLKYTGYLPRKVWIINHIAITKKYGGKYSKKLGGYKFESHADAVNFAQSYKIKTVLEDGDEAIITAYEKEQAAKKAEYYSNKAK